MQQLQDIMQKEMTRKEFLATIGFGIASIFGFSTLIKLLFHKGQQASSPASHGFGAGSYGGDRE